MTSHSRAALLLTLILMGSLLFAPVALGVGFGNPPGNREIIFRPGTEVRVPFLVINGEHLQVTASTLQTADPSTLGTPGDDNIMAYVSIDDDAPGTGPRPIEVVFRFPDHEMKPGTYPIDIHATDYVADSSGATITAVATVKLQLTVWVLSPDPLVHVRSVWAPPIAEGLQANASVTYLSRTTQDLTATANVRVVDANGTVLAQASAPSRALASGTTATDSIILPTERLAGGDYDLYATVRYADKTAEGGPGILKIGTLHVGIPAHTTEFSYNTTNRFRFTVENQWNRALQEVYATVTSGQQQKKTASLDIPPFGQTEYEVYFDRDAQLLPGPSTVAVIVTFRDYNASTGQYEPRVEPFSLPVSVLPPPMEERPAITLTSVLLWGLGLAVIALLVLLFILLRRRKEPPVVAQQATPAVPSPAASPGTASSPKES